MSYNLGFTNLMTGLQIGTSCLFGLGDFLKAKRNGADTGNAIFSGLGKAMIGSSFALFGNSIDRNTGTYFGSILGGLALNRFTSPNSSLGFYSGFLPQTPSIFSPPNGYCLPGCFGFNIR